MREDPDLPTRAATAGIALLASSALAAALLPSPPAFADARQEACKKAMNDRIQVCTDECTKTALAAASNYVDTNNNVKFGCLKGCAIRQMWQMRACSDGSEGKTGDPTETNR